MQGPIKVARLLPCKEETREKPKNDNEVIAEFMGFSCADTGQDRFWNPPGMPFATIYDWKYHSNHLDAFQTSWDWIMPVYIKFKNLLSAWIDVAVHQDEVDISEYERAKVIMGNIRHAAVSADISLMHQCLSEGIKWYNEHGK